MDPPDRLRLATRFAEEAKRIHPNRVRRVILFGSVARGEDAEESDIDVAVVWDGERREGLREMIRISYPLLLKTGEYISVKILDPGALDPAPRGRSRFVEAVLAEGRILA